MGAANPSTRDILMLVSLACGAGCGDDRALASVSRELDADVPPVADGPWARPAATTTWQWQLTGALNLAYEVEVYDVDLFDTPSATIDELHAAGRLVLCYFSAGSSESWRPDFDTIDSQALGEPLDGWPGERWLDIRAQSAVDLARTRLDLARDKGCDGVEPDNVDGYTNDTGFDLHARDQLAFNKLVANEAHERDLFVALKNDLDQVAALLDYFDLSVNEQCHLYDECALLAPFLDAGKPVFNAEYAGSVGAAETLATGICPVSLSAHLRTLILPEELDDAFRVSCDSP